MSREPGSNMGFLKGEIGSTATWYRIDNQEGSVPGGVIFNVNWTADGGGDKKPEFIYVDSIGGNGISIGDNGINPELYELIIDQRTPEEVWGIEIQNPGNVISKDFYSTGYLD